jgi:hypothetical protein
MVVTRLGAGDGVGLSLDSHLRRYDAVLPRLELPVMPMRAGSESEFSCEAPHEFVFSIGQCRRYAILSDSTHMPPTWQLPLSTSQVGALWPSL